MLSKPLRPWSKRQSGPETSPRMGELLPTLKHRASRLVLLPSDAKHNASSPVTTHYDTTLANAVGNLHIAVNHMLSSRSSSIRGPPRNRSQSTLAPLEVGLPADFPDSVLLGDGGQFSSSAPVLTTPTVKTTRNEDQQPRVQSKCKEVALNASDPGAPQLVDARSILERGSSYSLRKKNHTNNAPIANDAAQSGIPEVKRNRSFTAAPTLRRHLDLDAMDSLAAVMRNDFVKSGSKTSDQDAMMSKDYEEATSSEMSITAAHNEHEYGLGSKRTSQNWAISTSQSQSENSREGCESHVNALKRRHSVQVALFGTQARLYKGRTNKHDLRKRASSIWLTGTHSNRSPHTHIRESDEKPADMEPVNLKTCSRRAPTSFGTPGLEWTTYCLLSEPSLYKQDRAALQKQIDLLTAKLSNSDKNEQELRSVLTMTKMENADKTMHASKLAENIQGLQNTVTHLEGRLEVANMKRLDAEEQFLAWRDQKSPFDFRLPRHPASRDTNQASLDIPTDSGTGINSPNQVGYASKVGCLHENAPAAPVTCMEELQTQAKKKDAYIAVLETEFAQLQEKHSQLQDEHERVMAQLDLRHELLRETRASDKVIEQLRTAVINHESTIMEKEQTIYALRRQLEHYKLLLQAEIRQHAAMKLYVAVEEHPLPELTSLAKREDIDCWMEKLHKRLRIEQSKHESQAVADTPEAVVESLHHEIDFYISEIMLFKLDIKGYRSDIRTLKEMVAHQGGSQKPTDIEPTPSCSGTVASPARYSFAPKLGAFLGASPVMGDTDTVSRSEVCLVTPLSSISLSERRNGGASDQLLELERTQDFRNSKCNHSSTGKADRVDSALSPSPNALQGLEYLAASCSFSQFNQRSMSAPPLQLRQRPATLNGPTTGERGTTSKAEWEAASYRRCITTATASKSPMSPQTGLCQLMRSPKLGEEVAPTLSAFCERPAAYVSSQSPVESLSETGSVLSTASDYLGQLAPLSEGNLGSTTEPGVSIKAAVESSRKPAHIAPPTPTDSLVSHTQPSREEVPTKVGPHHNVPTMLPHLGVESGLVPEHGQSWYRSLPSMLSHMRRQSVSSIYSRDSCQKPTAGMKNEASLHLGKVRLA